MSLTDFKTKRNKCKINKYKINNNNKTNTKHDFSGFENTRAHPHLQKIGRLDFSLRDHEGEVKA
jgi:hypothetical protein